eukprot:gene8015-13924_t
MLLDGQRDETSTQQASSIEGNTEIKQEVHRVIKSQHKKGHVQTKKCHQCGGSYPHKNQTCPAAVGDTVLLKQDKKNKFSANFESTTYKVIYRKGSRVTAERQDGRKVTRKISFFKKFSKKDDDDDDLSDDDNHKRTETVEENNRENRYPLRQRRMPERYGTVVATD